MNRPRIFLYFCLSFIGGIFLSSMGFLPGSKEVLLLPGLILGILLISVLWRHKKSVVIGFCLLFLVLGIWRHQIAWSDIEYREVENISFIGMVSKEPDIRETHTQLTISEAKMVEAKPRPIKGKVLVTTNKYPEYKYGDKLKITGELKIPIEFPDFNYQDYLAKDGIYSVSYYPEIELLDRENGRGFASTIYGRILEFKEKLRNVIYQNLSPPQSSILGAMILGDKRQISQEWKEKLNYAGIRHLTAISGMHVAILTAILMSFLIGLGLWRNHSFFFTIILISSFIIMTGLQPSAIRAGIMGGLFLVAQYLGRAKVSSQVIVLAAVVMLAQNPLLLRLDVGFQLSFLAIIGIIYLSPIFRNLFRKIPNLFQLRNIISMTLSAQIFTLPILIYNFGYFSLIAPLTNILIVPLLPFIMGLGFIFGLAGLFWGTLGWVFSLPVGLLLVYLTKIVDWFSGFSWSVYTLQISWVWPVISYLILGLITWRLNEKQKLKFPEY